MVGLKKNDIAIAICYLGYIRVIASGRSWLVALPLCSVVFSAILAPFCFGSVFDAGKCFNKHY